MGVFPPFIYIFIIIIKRDGTLGQLKIVLTVQQLGKLFFPGKGPGIR
jgi:hypothetical protein